MSTVEIQNLIYALNQVIHNFGAATVVGIGTYGLIRQRPAQDTGPPREPLLPLAIAWAVQGASGATFGITSFYFNGELPDIHGVAITALIIKIACVITGFMLAVFAIWRHRTNSEPVARVFWSASLALGATALSAAAFLRWFS